ncbi:hypothetical protein VNO77_43426 [Canavalia gladiata]|uniref:Uncharacterized protein n=1 Tax=Canavalia gladiata TaxID=3824 RepID=A0AAN9JU18_CANGL
MLPPKILITSQVSALASLAGFCSCVCKVVFCFGLVPLSSTNGYTKAWPQILQVPCTASLARMMNPFCNFHFFHSLSLCTFRFQKEQEKLNQMVAKDYDPLTCVVGVKMGRIMQSIDYSRLFWLFFGVFSHVYHEGKPRI